MKITVKKPNLNVDTYRLKLVVAMLTNPTLGPACSATVRKAIETCSAPSGLDEKLEPLTELYSLAQQDSESALELIEAAEKIRAETCFAMPTVLKTERFRQPCDFTPRY